MPAFTQYPGAPTAPKAPGGLSSYARQLQEHLARARLRNAPPGVEVAPAAPRGAFEPVTPAEAMIGPAGVAPRVGSATGLEDSYGAFVPSQPPDLGPFTGPVKAAQEALSQMSAAVQISPTAEARLATDDPVKAMQAIREEGANAVGLNANPAKVYKQAGRDPNADFEAVLKAYNMQSNSPNVSWKNMDEDEKSAFLLHTGLRMMATAGTAYGDASTALGLMGGAALDALDEIRQRRAVKGQQQAALGGLLLQQRKDAEASDLARDRLRLEQSKARQQQKLNQARQRYWESSAAAGGTRNASADMQLISYFEDQVGMAPLEATEAAAKFKSTSSYGKENDWARKSAIENGMKAASAYRQGSVQRGQVPDSKEAMKVFNDTFNDTYSSLKGASDRLGFDPPENLADFLALEGKQQEAFIDSVEFDLMPEEIKLEIIDFIYANSSPAG